MTQLTLTILDNQGNIRTETRKKEPVNYPLTATENDFVSLAMKNFEYQEGDQIRVEVDKPNTFLVVKLDATLDSSIIYLKDTVWTYEVSFAENRSQARPIYRFAGNKHALSVRVATEEEVCSYRNWALNPHDQKEFTGAYPHAHANVETRNEATFFACNAIDGVYANHSHGAYPFQSWGINQQLDAALTIDFGRRVAIDKVVFTWRADFPHDSYWTNVRITFSDGSYETFDTEKTERPQIFSFNERVVDHVVFSHLVQDTDESPFPALTQIEFFGKNV